MRSAITFLNIQLSNSRNVYYYLFFLKNYILWEFLPAVSIDFHFTQTYTIL